MFFCGNSKACLCCHCMQQHAAYQHDMFVWYFFRGWECSHLWWVQWVPPAPFHDCIQWYFLHVGNIPDYSENFTLIVLDLARARVCALAHTHTHTHTHTHQRERERRHHITQILMSFSGVGGADMPSDPILPSPNNNNTHTHTQSNNLLLTNLPNEWKMCSAFCGILWVVSAFLINYGVTNGQYFRVMVLLQWDPATF